jgi:hypothetical protein
MIAFYEVNHHEYPCVTLFLGGYNDSSQIDNTFLPRQPCADSRLFLMVYFTGKKKHPVNP